MKSFYKLHIKSTTPITTDKVENMNMPDYAGRLVINEQDPRIASIILSIDDSGNPDLDEVSDFILMVESYGDASVFFGYPKKDMSNAVTEDSASEAWSLLDSCEVNY